MHPRGRKGFHPASAIIIQAAFDFPAPCLLNFRTRKPINTHHETLGELNPLPEC